VIAKNYFIKEEYLLVRLSNGLWQVFPTSNYAESMVVGQLTEDYYIGEQYQPIDPRLPLYRFVTKERIKGTFRSE